MVFLVKPKINQSLTGNFDVNVKEAIVVTEHNFFQKYHRKLLIKDVMGR